MKTVVGKHAKSLPATTLSSIRPDGSAVVKVAGKRGVEVSSPEYSPDGAKIAFLLGAYDKESKADGLYVAASDGSGAKQVARTAWADGVAWSPDGTTLVFTDVMDGVHSVPSAGGKDTLIVPVLDDGGFFRRPTFTPDGTTLIFERVTLSSNTDGKEPWLEKDELWRASADGSSARPLFSTAPVKFAGEPDVSPDGTTVAFGGPIDKYGKRWALYTAKLDGASPARTLYTSRKGRGLDSPTWSPTGDRIAVVDGTDLRGASLLVIDPATAAATTVQRVAKGTLDELTWQSLPAAP